MNDVLKLDEVALPEDDDLTFEQLGYDKELTFAIGDLELGNDQESDNIVIGSDNENSISDSNSNSDSDSNDSQDD